MPKSNIINVTELVDQQHLGWFQVQTVMLCFMVLILDGFDAQAIGYVAPAIIKAWGVNKAALGPVFSAGLFGLMLGAFVLGTAADRFGRKKIIITCLLIFGVFTLLTVTAHSLESLIVLRFLAGLGIGGAMPNAIALIAENSPRRNRATMVTIMVTGFSIGAAIGGFLAAQLLSSFGWTAIFYIGGLVPLVLVPIVIFALPESVRLLVVMQRPAKEITALLNKMNLPLKFNSGVVFVTGEVKLTGLPVRHLFTERRALPTVFLWTAFFFNLVGLYFLTNWMPTVIHGVGLSIQQAIIATAMFQVGGTIGSIALGRLSDRYGAYRVLTVTFVMASVFIALIGLVGATMWILATIIFFAGVCVVGGQVAANAHAGSFYPTAARSTGVGWALGMGRVGSVVGPLLGGLLLTFNLPLPTMFYIAAIPALCAATAIFLMGKTSRERETVNPRAGLVPDRSQVIPQEP